MNKYNDHIKAIKNNYPTSGYSALCEALDCAVDLMSKEMESAEKCECTSQEPCSFCNDDTEIGIEEVGPERICELTHTTGRNFQICYSQYVEAEFEFVYCPMCGRKIGR